VDGRYVCLICSLFIPVDDDGSINSAIRSKNGQAAARDRGDGGIGMAIDAEILETVRIS
jgi:hypothetical protein